MSSLPGFAVAIGPPQQRRDPRGRGVPQPARPLADGSEATPPAARQLPACDHLGAALAAGRSGPETARPRRCRAWTPSLAWTYSYPAHPVSPIYRPPSPSARSSAPVEFRQSERLRLGLTLIAPGTHYPPHAHPAIETYLVVAGTALLASRRGAGRGAAAGRADLPSQRHGPCHADRSRAAAGDLVLARRCDLAFGLSRGLSSRRFLSRLLVQDLSALLLQRIGERTIVERAGQRIAGLQHRPPYRAGADVAAIGRRAETGSGWRRRSAPAGHRSPGSPPRN